MITISMFINIWLSISSNACNQKKYKYFNNYNVTANLVALFLVWCSSSLNCQSSGKKIVNIKMFNQFPHSCKGRIFLWPWIFFICDLKCMVSWAIWNLYHVWSFYRQIRWENSTRFDVLQPGCSVQGHPMTGGIFGHYFADTPSMVCLIQFNLRRNDRLFKSNL